jgi:pSer/pThr/pTyr-binding forkhead associated (FHA) protein/predicted negative regulator of RcsB-dependent stress response
MEGSPKGGAEENTFIKAYDELEKSAKSTLRGSEAFPLLEIVRGPKQGAWFTVAYQKEITLGRASTNSIMLEDNSVSRSHSVLQASGNEFTIRDIGSRNGTFLNGKKIQEEVPLHHKDIIKIGIYTLRFLQEATDEPYELESKEEHTPALEAEEAPAEIAVQAPEIEAPQELAEAVAEEELAVQAGTEAEAAEEKAEGEDLGPMISEEAAPVVVTTGRSRALRNLAVMLIILAVFGGGSYLAYYFGAFNKLKANLGKTPAKAKVAVQAEKLPPPQVLKPESKEPSNLGQEVPVILETDAQPIPAKIFYKGKELGLTPFKISVQVPVGQPQELSADFLLEGIGEKWTEKTNFQVQKQDELVTVKFQPKLGSLKISALPKNGDLYLEGKYEGTPNQPKSIKLSDIAFNTPIYLPYGKYVAEIRMPEMLEGSNSPVNSIKFRREFEMSQASPEYTISASDEVIKTFPAKITSNPPGAELLLDGKKQGETPFNGNLPTGRHNLVLKKEGFNEFAKEISIELNTPYEANYNLMTTPAGEFINKGRDLVKKGQYNEAIEQLAEALKRNPEATELSQIHILLGDAFVQNKTYDQALAYYQKARENPEYATRADLGIAEAYAGLGQNDQALVKLVDTVLNTKDEKTRSDAESLYHKIYPMKSVLYLTTQPPGAAVTVNGNPVGQVTPVILSDLMVGSYRISVQKEGFKPFETRVTMSMSAIKPLIVNLEAQ